MTQTENAAMFVACAVDLSSDNSDWTEMDGFGASVAVDGGSVTVAEEHTFDGDTPIVKGGKRAAIDVTVRFLYTEEADEPFEIARAIYEAEGKECYVRYSPLSDDTDNFRFSTGLAVMTEFMYPQGEADSDELIPGEFTVKASELTKSTVT